MSPLFEELDYRPTAIGALSLRRRRDLSTGEDIFEILLGDEFLMSSRFTRAEEELAYLGLAALDTEPLDVVVGGLGLGYTARAAMEDVRVGSLLVVDALQPVIDWHQDGLLPVGRELTADTRCGFRQGDFFALAQSADGFDTDQPGRKFHAILLDIDHSPQNVLDPANSAFYTQDGLTRMTMHLREGGVFALWSNDPPEAGFEKVLGAVFTKYQSHVVRFSSPHNDAVETNTVYVAVL